MKDRSIHQKMNGQEPLVVDMGGSRGVYLQKKLHNLVRVLACVAWCVAVMVTVTVVYSSRFSFSLSLTITIAITSGQKLVQSRAPAIS